MKKIQIAKQKLDLLEEVVKSRSKEDSDYVKKHLTNKEKKLYALAIPYYSKGNSAGYIWDKRHIDFSTLFATIFSNQYNRNIIVPGIIFHDAGRYKTLDTPENMNWASFENRVWHMKEGKILTKRLMKQAGYKADDIEIAANLVGIHDWNYFSKFNVDKKLTKLGDLKLDFDGEELTLRQAYEDILKIQETGLLSDDLFKQFSDIDRINVPAIVSYYKDYYKNHCKKLQSILEFAYLRSVEFQHGRKDIIDNINPMRIDFIKEKASNKLVYTIFAKNIICQLMDKRIQEATQTQSLDLISKLSDNELKQQFNQLIEQENIYLENI